MRTIRSFAAALPLIAPRALPLPPCVVYPPVVRSASGSALRLWIGELGRRAAAIACPPRCALLDALRYCSRRRHDDPRSAAEPRGGGGNTASGAHTAQRWQRRASHDPVNRRRRVLLERAREESKCTIRGKNVGLRRKAISWEVPHVRGVTGSPAGATAVRV